MIKERKEREERQTKILNTMKAVQKSSRTHVLNEQLKLIEKESILSKKRPLAETSRFWNRYCDGYAWRIIRKVLNILKQ